MFGGKLKDAATRCVLRPADASKCVADRGSLTGEIDAPEKEYWINSMFDRTQLILLVKRIKENPL